MNAVIISIGTELTSGSRLDTNSAWLASALSRMGILVIEQVTVDDDLSRIRSVFSRSMEVADLVIATGGLGPTPDDLTRQGLASAISQPLERHAEAYAQLVAMFERWQRPMSKSNLVQAQIPRGCDFIPNPRGTAPGIHHKGDESEVFVLPGVPAEMRAMFEASILPIVSTRGEPVMVCDVRLRCFGISESKIGELLSDLMERDRNPQVGTAASEGVIDIRVVGRGKDEAEAHYRVERDVDEIRRRLGIAVFGAGDDTLESVVGALLRERGLTVSVAESCTGGLVAKRLTDVAGSSAYFIQGYVTYANTSKTSLLGVSQALIESEGAVSEAVVRAMASGCRTRSGSDYSLSISGIAGPGGAVLPDKPVGLVFIGLVSASGATVKRIVCGDHLSRGEIRDRACKAALNLLRRDLLGVEQDNPRGG